jgi:hypothetical protein
MFLTFDRLTPDGIVRLDGIDSLIASWAAKAALNYLV